MNYAIFLAGGVGSRFWPLSRQAEPKQFLCVYSDKTLIEESIQRILPIIHKENIFIATNKIHERRLKNCIKGFAILARNLFFEPEGKNTLAPIALLTQRIHDTDPHAVVAVFPSDHFIRKQRGFLRAVGKAMAIAEAGYIVTLGIVPTRPETGYGYIKVGEKQRMRHGIQFFRVERFVEKPERRKAQGYIKKGNYFWNSGIFIFRADVLLEEISVLVPQTYRVIAQLKHSKEFDRLWRTLSSISIDYAIMEKTRKAAVLPADYDWVELGSWRALEEISGKDKSGNIFKGPCVDLGSKNSIVHSENRLIATLGLKNMIVVDTKDALLVCTKDRTQDVKKVVGLIKERKILSRCEKGSYY